MNKILNKLLDVTFNFYVNISLIYFKYFKVIKSSSTKKPKGIMALPYYSKNYPGGESRIGDWKKYFLEEGVVYDVFWASEADFFLEGFYSNNPIKRYKFFFSVLNNRLKILRIINQYEAIWIQRAFVPFYPFKHANFEALISKLNPSLIIDYYDADYESNYKLTIDSVKHASRVTVASPYLERYFKKINKNTFYLPFAIEHEDYSLKEYENVNSIVIGWMGSPENFQNILRIEKELIEIEKLYPNVNFVFICRKSFKLNLSRVKFMSWSDDGFDYFQTIMSFDIGLAPMMDPDERNLAKTAFKSLEYMSSGLAFVSSPWGIPEHLVHQENVMIANSNQDWVDHLNALLINFDKRKSLGENAYATMVDKFSYTSVYKELKNILLYKKINGSN